MDRIKAKLATNRLQACLKKGKRKILRKIKRRDIVITAAEDDEKLGTLEHLCNEGADLKHLERQRGFGLIPNVFWCEKLIQFFIDRGADVNSRDENGDTALHLVIRHAHLDKYFHDDILNKTCPKNDRVKIIEFLLKKCAADKSTANLRGETAFVTLLKTGLWLPEDGMDFDSFWNIAKMIDCESVLMAQNFANDRADFINACEPLLTAGTEKNRRWQCCRILIERGVNVNVRDFQDYLDLHNIYEFAKLVFKMGANVKSESARDYYDLSIYHYILRPNGIRSYTSSNTPPPSVFTYGATPTKQVEIFEMAGAAIILRQCNWNGGFEQWSKVVDTCREFNLQPTQEFLDNYEFLREDLNNPTKDEMFLRAMNTVCRLSPDRKSTFWNVLSNFPFDTDPFYIFDFLPTQLLDSFEEFASTEEIDFVLLLEFVKCFDPWLEDCTHLFKRERESESWKNIVDNILDTPERISQFHSIANLGIACFDKLIHKTKCKKVSDFCMKVYLTLLQHLASLHILHLVVRGNPPETEELFRGNELLLRKLINLDLRDGDCNTWVHLIFMPDADVFNMYDHDKLTFTLFADEFVDARILKSKNRMGFEPAQLIDWKKCDVSDVRYLTDVMNNLANTGAHVDARNCWGERTLKDVFKKVYYKYRPNFAFKFDSLQCACARVLVRSVVPYRTEDGVPKFMVDFINSHEAWNSEMQYREELILKEVGS